MSDFDASAGSAGPGHEHGHGHEHEHGDEHGHGHERPRYLRVFKRLATGQQATIRHGLDAFPLVDVYQLQPFEVVSSADEASERASAVFYLYHTSDRSARVKTGSGALERVTLEDTDDEALRIPFADALRMHGVPYDDDRHLGDVVGGFWDALFAPPNDPFGEEFYANSPWLDRNVGDRRSIGSLKSGHEWNDLWLHVRPRKLLGPEAVPSGVEVVHLGLQTVGLRWQGVPSQGLAELPVMVLLRS